MPVFRDTDHLYRVLDALFRRIAADGSLSEGLLAGDMVLRFRYREPEGQITVDLRGKVLRWFLGETELEPDLEMIQSADVAHRFWLGRLNVPLAIATRQVVSRGPVPKALQLLPAVKPAFALYADVLRDLGDESLLPKETADAGRLPRIRQQLRRAVRRFRSARAFDASGLDPAELRTHRIPFGPSPGPEDSTPAEENVPEEPGALQVEMLRRMLLIRAFEQRLSDGNALGEVPTEAIHLSIGQEACAVGACFALRTGDAIATTHRGHGHMLAKGADLDGMMAEILGKASGLCRGKGGSMHVTDARVGALGANGIVGASPLIAAGAAHAARLAGSDRVAVAFLGDGATNQGMFHEAANFAAVLDLPVVFVVENNQYGEFTAVQRHTRVPRIAERAAAWGIPGVTVDGNDPWAVYEAMAIAVARARAGDGPTLLECDTYRWHGHMEGEAVPYRPPEEIESWKARCPILRWRRHLETEGLLSQADADAVAEAQTDRVEQAWSGAIASAEPAFTELWRDAYAPEPESLYRPIAQISSVRETTCARAVYEALAEELERDERTYLLGEDVTTGGYFAVTVGLAERFGAARVVDTPISEYAIVGTAVGAAMSGRRPIAEILFSDFLTTCADPLVNQAAKLRYMSGGQYTLPMVVRTPGGGGLGMAAQHSQSLEAWLTGVPGLIVLAPATPYDAKGMLKAAIRSNNPVLFFENKLLYTATGPVPEGEYLVPIGVADIKRRGRDATVVSVGAALSKALDAADELSREGVEAEVVDVRTLVPLDVATIVASVARTGRLVTVEDASLFHGFGAEVVARVAEVAFGALRSPPRRVAALDVPIPYNSRLENAVIPGVREVVAAVRATL